MRNRLDVHPAVEAIHLSQMARQPFELAVYRFFNKQTLSTTAFGVSLPPQDFVVGLADLRGRRNPATEQQSQTSVSKGHHFGASLISVFFARARGQWEIECRQSENDLRQANMRIFLSFHLLRLALNRVSHPLVQDRYFLPHDNATFEVCSWFNVGTSYPSKIPPTRGNSFEYECESFPVSKDITTTSKVSILRMRKVFHVHHVHRNHVSSNGIPT